ncbi:uncharacterized protein LOC133472092 isoform X2 [Phyllopteryx taeniolatus]|uniref:uncharacterized protein LOC133472092 isoform X2 n=1 Tax=Phyllopteryx taeniolatus TaxID=161469 RepID=UPI002AD55547|nr:uncharacterized protein LOC133472092 isoform X2 [Phyllopteryx taeniolatus]
MNSLEYPTVLFLLLAQTISLGRTGDVSFSICWMDLGNPLESYGNLWLNGTALKNLWTNGEVVSLTVPPSVENNVTLEYAGTVRSWTLTVSPGTKQTKVSGRQKPEKNPTSAIQGVLDLLDPSEVFPCENGTLFFYQDENFFLAFGHSVRYPVKVEARSPTTLLLSWAAGRPAPGGGTHAVALYRSDQGAYRMLSREEVTDSHYRLTSLNSCSPYVVCVDPEANFLITCFSTSTDPDVPRDFRVSWWNGSSISLTWDFPEDLRFSLFLLTSFHLNGTDHVVQEVPAWHATDDFVFTLSALQPCSRVRFGLQTVCLAGMESRYSEMILNDGNTAHSSIKALRQTSFGPDNYTLSWEVSNASSVSRFSIYHEGTPQGTTLATDYTVKGLLPCRAYRARVDALCGDGVLMSSKTLPVHTGPHGVLELRYRTNDSLALWIPGTPSSALSFSYELSLENGSAFQTANLTETELRLPGLEAGKTYVLELWERCEGRWDSERTALCFTVDNSTYGFLVRGVGLDSIDQDRAEEIHELRMVVPGSLPDDLDHEMSEATTTMVESVQNLLLELLSEVRPPIRVEVIGMEPAFETDKTQVQAMLFDASHRDDDMPLPVRFHMDYIASRDSAYVSVRDGVLYWDGPDVCATSARASCPQNSECVNTLGSFHCVCNLGYYDVSAVLQAPVPPHPVCNERGIFSQCLEKVMTGGVAKPYLTEYIGGKVEVVLNNATCEVEESGSLFHFRTPRHGSECGTKRRVNKTHIEFQNTLAVSLTKEEAISRRDLKVIWKCVYPLHYIRDAHVGIDLKWFKSYSLVEFNGSLQLGLTMDLFGDKSFRNSFQEFASMDPEDTLYFQVALDANASFTSNVLLHVESCWATETSDPQDEVQGVFLKDGCPIDYTFRWLSVNGVAQKSRFAMQMFHMPQELPLYFHCLASICGLKENCTKNCTGPQRAKRAAGLAMDTKWKRAAVVSAGPLVLSRDAARVQQSSWTESMTMIFIVVGLVGILGLAVLSVSATKAIMAFYAQQQKK